MAQNFLLNIFHQPLEASYLYLSNDLVFTPWSLKIFQEDYYVLCELRGNRIFVCLSQGFQQLRCIPKVQLVMAATIPNWVDMEVFWEQGRRWREWGGRKLKENVHKRTSSNLEMVAAVCEGGESSFGFSDGSSSSSRE